MNFLIRWICGLACLGLISFGCQQATESAPSTWAGTELFLPTAGDSVDHLHPVWVHFLSQIDDSSVVRLLVPQLEPWDLEPLLAPLLVHPGASMYLITDPVSWNGRQHPQLNGIRDSLREFARLRGQLVLENDRNPRAGWLGPNTQNRPERLKTPLLLANHLQSPEGLRQDVVLAFSPGALSTQPSVGKHAFSVSGDPAFYQSCLAAWTALAESRMDHQLRIVPESGPRRVAAFPQMGAESPFRHLLVQLARATEKTGQPIRIRACVNSWDVHHRELALQLRGLRELYEADIRLVLPPNLPPQLWDSFGPNRQEWIRKYSVPACEGYWLVEGPFANENGKVRRQQIMVSGITAPLQSNDSLHSGLWYWLNEPVLFEQMETEWNQLWAQLQP